MERVRPTASPAQRGPRRSRTLSPDGRRPTHGAAVRTRDDAVSITWGELRERVEALAGGLAARGVSRGDTVALLLSNRPEFHIADLAVMVLGGTSFSIYSTYAPNQIQFVVSDAGARVAIVERAPLLDNLLAAARASCPHLEHVIVLDSDESTPARARAWSKREDVKRRDDEIRHRQPRSTRSSPRRADAHLHVGHHGPTEGRRALAPQPPALGEPDSTRCLDFPRRAHARSPGSRPRTSPSAKRLHHYRPVVDRG